MRKKKISNDKEPFIWWLFHAERLLKDGGCLLCFCDWGNSEDFRSAIGWAGLKVGGQLIWDRMQHGMGDPSSRPSPRHDVIWFAVKGKYSFHGRRPASVYRHKSVPASKMLHPNQKPLDLLREMVVDYCPIGGTVLDPCMGCGSSAVAAYVEHRKFIGIELDKGYFNEAKKRVSRVAGLSGQTSVEG